MKVLVFFASIEGQTQKIAEAIAAQLERAGHEALLADANQVGFVGAGTHDASIMCAPIHMHRYPTPFVHFVHEWKDALNSKPSAFVSVSLSAASKHEEERDEARAIANELMQSTGWKPVDEYQCAGAIRYTKYDFFKRWVMKRIAQKEDGATDTSRDYELTDWSELSDFVAGFLADAQTQMNAA